MVKMLLQNLADTMRFNAQMSHLKLSGYGRRRYQMGFNTGYRVGREQLGVRSEPAFMLPEHAQVELDGIEVDEGMAPLLGALWSLGLETQYSCQGHIDYYLARKGPLPYARSQIVFEDIDQGYRFVTKTLELLGHSAFRDGGIELDTMEPVDTQTFRVAVWFSPDLLTEISELWIGFAKSHGGAYARTGGR